MLENRPVRDLTSPQASNPRVVQYRGHCAVFTQRPLKNLKKKKPQF